MTLIICLKFVTKNMIEGNFVIISDFSVQMLFVLLFVFMIKKVIHGTFLGDQSND